MASSRDLVVASPGSCYNTLGCSYGGVGRQRPQWSSRWSRWESLALGASHGVICRQLSFWRLLIGRFRASLVGKEPAGLAGNEGVVGSIPGLGRSPGGGNGSQLQYPCLGNPTDRGAWWATVRGLQRVGHDWAWMHTWVVGSEQLWLTERRPGSVHLVWRCFSELTVQ